MIEKFPLELQLQIFGFLNSRELSLAASTCKRWYMTARSPLLRKKIKIDGDKQSWKEIISIIRESSWLRELEFLHVVDWYFIPYLPNCLRLRTIKLDICTFDESDFAKLIDHFPLIENLSIRFFLFADYYIEQIVRWKFLKYISLTITYGVVDNVICSNYIRKLIPGLKKLELTGFEDTVNVEFERTKTIYHELAAKSQALRQKLNHLREENKSLREELSSLQNTEQTKVSTTE